MAKKIITILLSLVCIAGLVSCTEPEKEKEELPPVTTVGLPENEKVTANYENDGFVINVYETYSEIVEYKGKEAEVTVPDAFMGMPVRSVGEYAFFGNEVLTKITLPDSLISIGKSAFQDCTSLVEAVLGSRLEMISQAAFRDSALEKINIPDSVATIERYAFYRTRLTEIKLPTSVSTVAKYSFYGCSRLTKITFSPRVEKIGEYAFSDCDSLVSVVITDGIELLGDYCFSECAALEKVFVPKNTGVGENVFYACERLTLYSPKGSKAADGAKKYGYSVKECASAGKMP
ncbi:MAG: leucine-rich repeat domain-containing protein [Clostridia bacterium]|nr:leucine-rich repeat domain-containing protein [Clostridia bacterium]